MNEKGEERIVKEEDGRGWRRGREERTSIDLKKRRDDEEEGNRRRV